MITPLDQTEPDGANEGLAPHQTIWGLDELQLHDRFWAACGVQVVRLNASAQLSEDADLFLLTDPHSLSIFRLGQPIDTLRWLKPKVLFVRLHNTQGEGYSERVITDENDRFVRFERVYSAPDWRLGRVALTSSRELAQAWLDSANTREGWKMLRRSIPPNQRTTASVGGSVYDRSEPQQVTEFIRELVSVWKRPDATIQRAQRLSDQVWCDMGDNPEAKTRFIGPVWVGKGRELGETDSIVGPAVLWDSPEARPAVEDLQWGQIELGEVLTGPVKLRKLSNFQRNLKRVFDFTFAVIALLLTLPVYPFVMLAILLEDGRPFFFAHVRESQGGVEFPCLKFRTMRKDAEDIKKKLMEKNQADGPQFFIDDDPRISRVGKVLRKTNIDELPQFLNVVVGHMAIVGPRPSPYKENQYCPPWREARLSVRPGVTGLWQVMRSRDQGKDFQEWIRYDIEYVENWSWKMDFKIILKTMGAFVGMK
ncbi:MAG: sugar transferase [Planctomycetota bacterium]